MTLHLVFVLLGLAGGAVYASLALALVVTYRSSGVVNFATGSIGLVTAYMYAYFRQGKLLVLIPGLPTTVDLGGNLGFAPALAFSLIFAALLGIGLYAALFRPLRTALPVAKAVASLAVAVILTGLILQRAGSSPVSVSAIFPNHGYHLGGVRVAADRLWFAATVVVVGLVIGAAYRFTRFGLYTRAVAETEKGAAVSGISSDRIAALNWMISAMVAGLAGILVAPLVPLVPAAYTFFIVPALAAAIVGQFRYLLPAVIAGLAIGMIQSELQLLKTQHAWLPQSGLPELVPLLLILLVLVVRAKPLPERGAIIQQSLGVAPRPHHRLVPTLVFTGLGGLALVQLHGTWRSGLVTSLIFSTIGLSLVVVTGFAGQVSLAQLTLAGVSGFAMSTLTTAWGVPFPIAPIVAAAVATIVGVVVGLPALRIRGLPVAVVTLGLAMALEALWFRNSNIVGSEGAKVRDAHLFGINMAARVRTDFPRLSFGFLALATLVLVALAVSWLRTSRLGTAMLAVRANERSAAAAGINVYRTKIAAFAISAFIAGIGGALLAYKQRTVTFDSYQAMLGLSVFAMVYLAGITSVSGGVLSGFLCAGGLFTIAADKWLSWGAWFPVVGGVVLAFNLIRQPEGMLGPLHAFAERRHAARRIAPATTPTAGRVPSPQAATLDHSDPIMRLRNVTVRYGEVSAVLDVSFDVPRGAIVGLIGPNGAGKTTLMDAISGFVDCLGSVEFDGKDITRRKPHQRARMGLGRTFQGIELWEDLTVMENLMAGSSATRGGRSGKENVNRLMRVLEIDALAERPVRELSRGHRQLVSIARALVAGPDMLVLDEPAAGLDTTESVWLASQLRRVRDTGVTILIIDHDMGLVLGLCDEVQVLDVGQLICSGSPSSIRRDPAVVAAYLGTVETEAAREVE